jgi:hypothetical protein
MNNVEKIMSENPDALNASGELELQDVATRWTGIECRLMVMLMMRMMEHSV